jgi:hypothetical protein
MLRVGLDMALRQLFPHGGAVLATSLVIMARLGEQA